MTPRTALAALATAWLLGGPGMVQAQTIATDRIDTRAMEQAARLLAQDLLHQTPDAQIDALFHGLQAAAREPGDARALCALFDPQTERSMASLQQLAGQLGPQAQQALLDALAQSITAALQGGGTVSAYDPAQALQLLKANVARAAMLHDGFTAGLTPDATTQVRCESLRQMFDVLGDRPQSERAPIIRYLLDQGLQAAMP